MSYHHLTLEDRRTIVRLLDAKVPVAEIASQLGRHRSTIVREIGRNLFREVKEYRGYFPITADDSARRRQQRRRKLIRDARLRQHVSEMLARWWSPEPIAGRLRLADGEACLSHGTIDQFVCSPEGRALALHRHLLRARQLRRRRFGRKARGPKIPLERTIAQRPVEIDRRQEVGHREADLLIFRRTHGKANVTSPRRSDDRRPRRGTDRWRGHRWSSARAACPVSSRTAAGACSVSSGRSEALITLPPAARRTITFDRGSEFLGYDHLARSHGMKACFCDPHSPLRGLLAAFPAGVGSRAS